MGSGFLLENSHIKYHPKITVLRHVDVASQTSEIVTSCLLQLRTAIHATRHCSE
jgi:hypothetical protein